MLKSIGFGIGGRAREGAGARGGEGGSGESFEFNVGKVRLVGLGWAGSFDPCALAIESISRVLSFESRNLPLVTKMDKKYAVCWLVGWFPRVLCV